ncbi:MAG: hypothetical protein ACRCVG_08310 [Methanobacteriaceae archaeon]
MGRNPCFVRILFAIANSGGYIDVMVSRNPCFVRILFAIWINPNDNWDERESQSLFC